MAKKDQKSESDFPTMGTTASAATNISGAPSPNTKPVAKKGGAGGMVASATASHRPQLLERNGASLHITTALYQANAAEAGLQKRNVRTVPSALGNRDFWAARQDASA
jgi:hypothetical protein